MKIAPSSVQELPGNARTPLSLFGDGIEAEQKIIDEETNLVRSIATQSWCRTFFWFIDVSQGKLWRKRWTVCNSFCRKIRHRVWFIQMPSPPTWLQIRIFWRDDSNLHFFSQPVSALSSSEIAVILRGAIFENYSFSFCSSIMLVSFGTCHIQVLSLFFFLKSLVLCIILPSVGVDTCFVRGVLSETVIESPTGVGNRESKWIWEVCLMIRHVLLVTCMYGMRECRCPILSSVTTAMRTDQG